VKIYVGNLSYSTDNDGLRAAFEQFGAVNSAEVVIDRNRRRRGESSDRRAEQQGPGRPAYQGQRGEAKEGRLWLRRWRGFLQQLGSQNSIF